MVFSEFEKKVQNAKQLDFGDIFNKSIELFKKVWLQGLVMLLLTMLLMLPLYFLFTMPLVGLGLLDSSMLEQGVEPNPVLMIPFGLCSMLMSLIAMVIGFGMKAGFYRICKLKDLQEAGPDDYFYYLKRPYLGKLVKLSLAIFGISFLATLLCVFPLIYVIVPIALMNVIFAFNPELSVREIIKAGFALGNKKWLLTFGLLFVTGLLAGVVGMLLCFVGVYVTASFSYLPAYYIYKESIGFNDEDEIKQIENTY
ncbi:MAG: hypothetical protein ACPG6B_05365 [Oceanihabitans sp.]